MSEERELGVGGGEWEPKVSLSAPTPHTLPPTPREPHWRLLYAAVITELALLIVIFYAFTKAFA